MTSAVVAETPVVRSWALAPIAPQPQDSAGRIAGLVEGMERVLVRVRDIDVNTGVQLEVPAVLATPTRNVPLSLAGGLNKTAVELARGDSGRAR